MILRCWLLVVACLLVTTGFSQIQISGSVVENGEAVPFATVQIKPGNLVVACDEAGLFSATVSEPGKYDLIVSAVGFELFQQRIQAPVEGYLVSLEKATNVMDEVAVTGTMRAMSVRQSPVKTEVISDKFLSSMPTYSVIESLNFVNGVQEVVNCGVCATNDIHINGMEGAYTLLLIDGMPIMSSLASVYGFNGIPNSLIEQIEIVKGPSSTLYGTEAVGGVINIITKSPDDMPLLSLASSYSTHDEWNADAVLSARIGSRIDGMISTNYFRNDRAMDFNADNFTDIPLNERVSVFNKWQLKDRNGDKVASIAARYYNEDRFGGVLNWTPDYLGSDSIYGEFIQTQRIELIGTTKLYRDKLSLDASYNHHYQDSYYGDTPYEASQHVGFANLLWKEKLTNHHLIIGLTQRYQTYKDNTFAASDDKRYIPGVFVQDEWLASEKFVVMAGSRLDHHDAHGWIFAPRANFKFSPSDFTAIRLNAGSGFRVVNLFTEDHAALTGARQVVIADELMPEESWNLNMNVNHVYQSDALGFGVIDLDIFNTWFSNKIVPDYEVDPNLIVYDNLSGTGISRGVSLSINHTFSPRFDMSIGGTYLDVFETVDGEQEVQLLTPDYSFKVKASWLSPWQKLKFEYSGIVTGPMQLPTYEGEFARQEVSDPFGLHHLQVSRDFGAFNCFVGVKNLTNYTQDSPLVDPANPFGDNFDTAYAYGPLQTRRFVFGMRFDVARDR